MGISLWWEFGLDILKKFTSLQFPFLFPFPSLVVYTPPTPMSSFYMLLAPSFCSSLMFTLVTHIAMLSLCMLIALACCSSLMFTLVTHIDASQSPSGSDALKLVRIQYIENNVILNWIQLAWRVENTFLGTFFQKHGIDQVLFFQIDYYLSVVIIPVVLKDGN